MIGVSFFNVNMLTSNLLLMVDMSLPTQCCRHSCLRKASCVWACSEIGEEIRQDTELVGIVKESEERRSRWIASLPGELFAYMTSDAMLLFPPSLVDLLPSQYSSKSNLRASSDSDFAMPVSACLLRYQAREREVVVVGGRRGVKRAITD